MRQTSFFLILALGLAACQSTEDYSGAMRHQHDGETPTASGAVDPMGHSDATGERIVYATVNGADVTGYLARPASAQPGDALPGIIVIHEWWGLNENVEAMTRKLAALGYTALAVDLYSGTVATTPDQAMTTMRAALANDAALTENLRQAYNTLTSTYRAPRVGSLGWCFGGGMSLKAALALPDDLDATVIYYGSPVTDAEALASLTMPVLGLFGGADSSIPQTTVDAFEAALEEAGVTNEIVVYPGAAHAFANPSGQRYDATAAEDAWTRVQTFFADHLKQ